MIRRLITRLFRVERMGRSWDVLAWPVGRIYYEHRFTSSGLLRAVGVYRLGRFDYRIEWWRAR